MSKLEAIARSMRAEALREGAARYRLPKGLNLELLAGEEPLGGLVIEDLAPARVWVLRLSRDGTDPSPLEVTIVRGAFGVPSGAEAEREGAEVVIKWPMN